MREAIRFSDISLTDMMDLDAVVVDFHTLETRDGWRGGNLCEYRGVRVCITGGAGFIGAATCRALLERDAGIDIVVLDDLSTGRGANLFDLGVELRTGSVADPGAVRRAVIGADAVVHLAARVSVPASVTDPAATVEVNVGGTAAVAAALDPTTHLILASSAAVYGPRPRLPTSERAPAAPASPYAASKLAAERIVRSGGNDHLVVRPFNVFGPGQSPAHGYAAAVPAFAAAAVTGCPVTVHGDGRQTRDFIAVDVVAATLATAVTERITSPVPVNVASGRRRSLLDVLAVMEVLLGRPVPRRHVAARAADARHSQADVALLCDLFPGLPTPAFEDGLLATLHWFASAGQMAADSPDPTACA
jgi:UDP-glucose 4-epimerase